MLHTEDWLLEEHPYSAALTHHRNRIAAGFLFWLKTKDSWALKILDWGYDDLLITILHQLGGTGKAVVFLGCSRLVR